MAEIMVTPKLQESCSTRLAGSKVTQRLPTCNLVAECVANLVGNLRSSWPE